MEDLILVINKLQDVFTELGSSLNLELPQIVVVGSQSSGKSSVLEMLVGRDFLPRGVNMVTRRPLVLQLCYRKSAEDAEYGEFSHLPDKKFVDFQDIRREIEADTDRVVGKAKGISSKPINLKVFSPNVINLTLVDLPGVTKISLGDQPRDIDQQIRDMVLQYIERPTSIILAVSPANVDIANSDALALAREVDPQGRRTIGLLTKLDLMDKGTDALDILTGRAVAVAGGFVGLVCRSQQDTVQGRSIKDALAAEAEFFSSHKAYASIAPRMGSRSLARILNKMLIQHIRTNLPDLKRTILSSFDSAERQLRSLGSCPETTSASKGGFLLNLMGKFVTEFRDSLEGRLQESHNVDLIGGASICHIFHHVFPAALEVVSNPKDFTLTQEEVVAAIRNATGLRPSLFVPEQAFDVLVKRLVLRLESPCIRCVHDVYDQLGTVVALRCESQDISRFPNLRDAISEVVAAILRRFLQPTLDMITSVIKMETAYINTGHPDFIGSRRAIFTITQGRSEAPASVPRDRDDRSDNPLQTMAGLERIVNDHPLPNLARRNTTTSISEPPTPAPLSPQAQPRETTRAPPVPRDPSGSLGRPTQAASMASSTSTTPKPNPSPLAPASGLASGTGPAQAGGAIRQGTASAAQTSAPKHLGYLNQIASALPLPSMLRSGASTPQAVIEGPATLPHSTSSTSVSSDASERPVHYVPLSPADILPNAHPSSSSHRSQSTKLNMQGQSQGEPLSQRDQMQVDLIIIMLKSYLVIVTKNVQDLVPKAIMHLLVNSTLEALQSELVSELYRESLFDQLLQEDPQVTTLRRSCEATLQAAQRAIELISRVNDLC